MGRGAEIQHRLPALKALTSFRFFAAIYVVLFHLGFGLPVLRVPVVGNFIASGNSGVPFFFVLSGFILAYNYAQVDNLWEFWTARFARIYPVYFIALCLGFSLLFLPASVFPSHIVLRWVLGLTLLHAWYRPLADTFNLPGWTLSVEALFYAVFPFVLPWVRRMTTQAFFWLCSAYLAFLSLPLWGSARPDREQIYFLRGGSLPLLYLPMFVIGIYLGVRYLRRGGTRRSWWLVLATLSTLLLLCTGSGESDRGFRKGVLVLSYAALIYGLASVRHGLLTNRWMVLAGEISFSIYILQAPIIRLTKAVARRLELGPYPTALLVLPVLILASYLAYRFIELPARLAIRARLAHRRVSLGGLKAKRHATWLGSP